MGKTASIPAGGNSTSPPKSKTPHKAIGGKINLTEIKARAPKDLVKFLKPNTCDFAIFPCFCEEREDVVLECGHSFCAGCFSQITDRKLSQVQTPAHERAYSHSNFIYFDNENYKSVKFNCPKCLAYTKISTFLL